MGGWGSPPPPTLAVDFLSCIVMPQSQASAQGLLCLPPQLHGLAALASLLERIEQGKARPDASQYRLLVERIREQLDQLPMEPALSALLDAFPAAAEVYENLRYDRAGLCRTALDRSVASERLARDALRRAAGSVGG